MSSKEQVTIEQMENFIRDTGNRHVELGNQDSAEVSYAAAELLRRLDRFKREWDNRVCEDVHEVIAIADRFFGDLP